MYGISGIGGIPAGGMTQWISPAGNINGAQAACLPWNAAGAEVPASQTTASRSTSSISAGSESLIASNGPVLGDDKALGLALLLLTMEHLQSDDEDKKKGLLGLVLALALQQQGGGNGASRMYNLTSLSVESPQMQAVSAGNAVSAYSAATFDPGVAGLDVSV